MEMNLRKRRNELALSQVALSDLVAKRAGEPFSQQAYQKLEANPSAKSGFMHHILAIFEDLESQKGIREQGHFYNTTLLEPTTKDVPEISWISAGKWCESPDNYEPLEAEAWHPRPRNSGPHTIALRVNGDSMTSPYPGQRTYPEGMIIYVDPDREVTNGCRVVARTNGEYTFKTYVEDGGRKYLKPINPTWDKIDITDDIDICGVVIGSYLPE